MKKYDKFNIIQFINTNYIKIILILVKNFCFYIFELFD